MKNILLLILLYTQTGFGQKLKRSEKSIIENLTSDIRFLASDKMEGRRTGTPGEKLAYEYLSGEFEKTGLIPKGDEGTFIQSFRVKEGKQVLPVTYLIINDDSLTLQKDYFPLIFSSDGEVAAFASTAFNEKGSPWFWDIKELLDSHPNNPHFNLAEAIKTRALESEEKGASAFIVYNSGTIDDQLKFEATSKEPPIKIPVLFITKDASRKYLSDQSANLDIKLQIAIGEKTRTGHNVAGYIDNNAPYTIIVGAHYDHLGYGEDNNSLWTGKPQIHNGADDNASGTALVLELARLLKKSKLTNYNYLFLCFSGEELGLLGSKYFTQHPAVSLDSVNYMINCDMVGRLNDNTHALNIGGYGTSPAWSKLLPEKTRALTIKFDSSGTGPSDYTSFYLKDIPVLFFFTGTHRDYHQPTDDVEKINATGELRILQYIYDIIDKTNKMDKLVFSKTRQAVSAHPTFTVSLGFMPDYAFSGIGVRADAITNGKTAQKAGMIAGDIITGLGGFTVTDLNSYMAALGKFKKGDTTKVTIQRGKEELTFSVTF